jgi:hypothetical protein
MDPRTGSRKTARFMPRGVTDATGAAPVGHWGVVGWNRIVIFCDV